jgi:phosphoserine phosphatase
MDKHAIAVFDVCGTLTRTNNTRDFIGYVLKRERSLRYGLLVMLRILAGFFHLPGVRSLWRRDFLRAGQIALLRGYSCARLREMAVQYVDALYAGNLWHRRVLDALQEERSRGKAIYLVSSAIDPPIREIAARLNVAGCLSSELQTRDGHYTGRLKTDLLGRKHSVLEEMPVHTDWQDSCVYSNNREDADFMARFGRRHAVLNTPEAAWAWDTRRTEFEFLVNYDEPETSRDVDSVNERTVKWVYIPLLYYIISRFHRRGVLSLLLREIVPVTGAAFLVTNFDVFSLVVLPLSFLLFYATYEIGGLVNDLAAPRETWPKGGTRRLAPGVRPHLALFVALRLVLVGLALTWLSRQGYPALLYLGALGLCLLLSFLHTLILSDARILTFLGLKVCRNAIPLLILAHHVPAATLVHLCAIFFVLDAPWRLYVCCRGRGLLRGTAPVWHVRCVTVALLWGLGAVLYVATGTPHLLALASYYVALEGLWLMRGPWRSPAWAR